MGYITHSFIYYLLIHSSYIYSFIHSSILKYIYSIYLQKNLQKYFYIIIWLSIS